MSFYRKPSPLEITYSGSDTKETSPFVNQFIIEGEGIFELSDWEDAVEKVAKANPGSRLRLKGLLGWKYWDDKGPLPKVIEIDTDWDGASSEGAPIIGNPISIRKGPTAEIILMKSKTPRVLFRTHHSITDGIGTIYWILEIFRALRGEPLLGSTGTYNEWDIAKSRDYPPRPVVEGNCIPVTSPSQNPSNQGCHWARLTLPGRHSKILANLVKIFSNIAWKNNSGKGKVIFRIPSNLRGYAEEGAPFSMANNSGVIDLEVNQDMSVSDIQQEISRSMETNEDLSVFPKIMYLVNWVPASLFKFRPELTEKKHSDCSYRMTGIVSFLGVIDLNYFSYDKFTGKCAYGVPIPLEDRSLIVGFSLNALNGLDAVISMPKALATMDEIEQFCAEVKEELKAL